MKAKEIKVLLVEDSPSDAEFVRAALAEPHGVTFTVTVAPRLADAVAHLQSAGADAVLLDLGLPDSQGLPTLEELFQVCGADTAIVVLTGNDDEALGPQALQLGAQDFLSKKHITNGRALTRCLSYGHERMQRGVMERQIAHTQRSLEVARAIQQHLIPKAAPSHAAFDIAGMCNPAEATGGDFFDFIPMAGGRLGVVVADVAGHGFGPALIMAGTRRALRSVAKTTADPGAILTFVNEAVCEDTDPESFVTLFLACLDQDGTVVCAGAGHNAHLFDADGRVTRLDAADLPLGLVAGGVYASTAPVVLRPGQLLLLVSDGVYEAHRTEDGPQVGLPAVLDYVRDHRHLPATAIVDGLVESVLRFCYPACPHDDMTAVVVKCG